MVLKTCLYHGKPYFYLILPNKTTSVAQDHFFQNLITLLLFGVWQKIISKKWQPRTKRSDVTMSLFTNLPTGVGDGDCGFVSQAMVDRDGVSGIGNFTLR